MPDVYALNEHYWFMASALARLRGVLLRDARDLAVIEDAQQRRAE